MPQKEKMEFCWLPGGPCSEGWAWLGWVKAMEVGWAPVKSGVVVGWALVNSGVVVDNANIPGWWEDRFEKAMVKMAGIEVKTGDEGQIRKNCRAINYY